MKALSSRTADFTDSVIRRMTRVSNQHGAVNLSQGFPDFDPPREITDRLSEVAKSGPHQYALTEKLLSDKPLFFLVNSYTTGLQPAVLTYMLNTAVARRRGGHVVSSEIGLPVSANGLVLPCGASGRWSSL